VGFDSDEDLLAWKEPFLPNQSAEFMNVTELPLSPVEQVRPERAHYYLMSEAALYALLTCASSGRGLDRVMMDIYRVADQLDLNTQVATPAPEYEDDEDYEGQITIYVQDWVEEEAE
jgi:hypothetical protein